MDEREEHLRGLAATSRAKPHFQMLTWKSAEWAVDEIDRLRGAWRRAPPDEQGYWWWWNEDGPPIPVSIFVSHTGEPRYFATVGQHGWNRAQWVEDMGGMWMRLSEPETP